MEINLNPKKIGWTPYVYLVYLIFLFIQPVLSTDYGLRNWLFTFALMLVFLPLYFISFQSSGRKRLVAISGLALLGLIGTSAIFGLFNSGASCFFIYAAAAAAAAYKPFKAVLFFVFILLLNVIGFFIAPYTIEAKFFIFAPGVFFTLLVGFVGMFEAERERGRSRLELANEEIEHLATIAERERIARDLHDLLGHTLSLITLKSELASKLIDKDVDKARSEIQEVERISRETLAEVRSAVSGYRQQGFMSEIASAKLALEAAKVNFAFKGDANILNALQESTLSLVLREAVTNIIRHADASHCSVELKDASEKIEFEIRDDGKGMVGEMGNGLSGIRDRVLMLGGHFEVDKANSSQGLKLRISLPKDFAVQTKIIPN